MNPKVKERMREANSTLSVGIGGIILAGYLVALLTWFPVSAIGQPIWLLNCLEIAVSLMFAYFGVRHFWWAAPSVTSSAWGVDGTELYPHVTYASYHSVQFRAELLNAVFLIFFVPFKLPQDYLMALNAIRLILSIFFLIVILNDKGKNNVSTGKYKKVVPKELRKENTRLLRRTNLPIISSAFFGLSMIVAVMFDLKNGWQITVDQSLNSLFVLLALIPLAIHLVCARRISRWQSANNLRIEGEQPL